MAVEVRWEPFRGREVAAVDFAAAADAVQGVLPCSDGERQVLLVAASIAEGIPVDLREAALVHGRGERRAGRPGGVPCGRPPCAGGDGGRPVTAVLPGTVRLTRPRHPFEGRQLPVLGSMLRHGAMELLVVLPDGVQAADPGGVDRPGVRRRAGTAATGRGRWGRWRTCWACLCWFRRFPPVSAG